MRTELNGFDESGNIGKSLIFVRACITLENIFRPYVYNLIHFNSLTISKNKLRGQNDRDKRSYQRMILNDPAIDVNYYHFPIDTQLSIMRQFMVSELSVLFGYRGGLINGFLGKDDLEKKASKLAHYLERCHKPWKYIELLMKSYGHKMVITDLQNTSNILRGQCKDSYQVYSLIDGGLPFVSWAYPFLEQSTRALDGSPFSFSRTPILGLSKGDEYFPIINVAGNLAYIANSQSYYPHSMKAIPACDGQHLKEFISGFRDNYTIRRFIAKVKRIFFAGFIPQEYQYSIPFVLYLNSGYKTFYEGFRAVKSIKDFKKEFGLNGDEFIVKGDVRQGIHDTSMLDQADDYGIEIKEANEFFDPFCGFINKVRDEVKLSTLTKEIVDGATQKLDDIEAMIHKYINK